MNYINCQASFIASKIGQLHISDVARAVNENTANIYQ